MRSSKSRSRNKNRNNNNRPSGNIVNRVFDSSGPEGKVRGTPQQIIDKYNQLARDAQLSGDRVALENFQQHSEHYTRMLAEAQREMEAKRAEQDRQRDQNHQNRDRNDGGQQTNGQNGQPLGRDDNGGGKPDAPQGGNRRNTRRDDRRDTAVADAQPDTQPDVDMSAEPAIDSNLVETPEATAQKPRRPRTRKPATPKPDATPEAPEAAE